MNHHGRLLVSHIDQSFGVSYPGGNFVTLSEGDFWSMKTTKILSAMVAVNKNTSRYTLSVYLGRGDLKCDHLLE